MEIEKKYLVAKLPEGLDACEKWEIEQCYLCTEPTIRIRRKNDDYILTYKSRVAQQEGEKLCVAREEEMPLSREAYRHLREKADGEPITKTRYRIPYGSHIIELDIFHGKYDGFYLAEVEFTTIEESRDFTPPEWFGADVSGDYRYTNAYMALEQ